MTKRGDDVILTTYDNNRKNSENCKQGHRELSVFSVLSLKAPCTLRTVGEGIGIFIARATNALNVLGALAYDESG